MKITPSYYLCALSTKMALFWFAPVRLIGIPDEVGLDSGGGPFWPLPEHFPYLKTLLDVFLSFKVIGQGQIVESGMKLLVVVIINVGLDDFPGLLISLQGLGPDTFGLKGLMEAFEVSVGLRMAKPNPGRNHLLLP
nr:hypothetical protein [Leptospirillum ferriphilum]